MPVAECDDYIWFFYLYFGHLLNVIKNTFKDVTVLVHLSTLCPHIGAPGNGSPSSVENIIKNTSTAVAQAEDKSGPSGICLCLLPLLISNTSYPFIFVFYGVPVTRKGYRKSFCHPNSIQPITWNRFTSDTILLSFFFTRLQQ